MSGSASAAGASIRLGEKRSICNQIEEDIRGAHQAIDIAAMISAPMAISRNSTRPR